MRALLSPGILQNTRPRGQFAATSHTSPKCFNTNFYLKEHPYESLLYKKTLNWHLRIPPCFLHPLPQGQKSKRHVTLLMGSPLVSLWPWREQQPALTLRGPRQTLFCQQRGRRSRRPGQGRHRLGIPSHSLLPNPLSGFVTLPLREGFPNRQAARIPWGIG